MTEHVLVTGGAGYLGSVLCEVLLREGYRVTALDNLTFGEQSLFHLAAHPGFEFVRGDARDAELLARLVRDADAIIPLAALVGAPACDRDPDLARSLNVEAIRTLSRLRSPRQALVYPTTNSGYGTRTGERHCTEDTPLEPISLYGRTKSDAERLVLDSPNAVALRLATVFGLSPRMRLDLLVNHFTFEAVTHGYLVVFEKDFNRNFVHVRDVADCFVHCLRHAGRMAGRTYNVGNDSANCSKEGLARLIQRHVPNFYVHYAAVGSDPDKRDYVVSSQRLREAGFEARRSLDEGVRELIKGYRLLGRGRFQNV